MDHRNSGLPELRILVLKSATADLSVSQRQPLARFRALAGRCGPVMTELGIALPNNRVVIRRHLYHA